MSVELNVTKNAFVKQHCYVLVSHFIFIYDFNLNYTFKELYIAKYPNCQSESPFTDFPLLILVLFFKSKWHLMSRLKLLIIVTHVQITVIKRTGKKLHGNVAEIHKMCCFIRKELSHLFSCQYQLLWSTKEANKGGKFSLPSLFLVRLV